MDSLLRLIERHLGPRISAVLAALVVYLSGKPDLETAIPGILDWVSNIGTQNTVVAGLIGGFVYLTRRAQPVDPPDLSPPHSRITATVVSEGRDDSNHWSVDGDDRPIGLRQNNPLNIEATVGKATRWRGEVDSDNRYARFSEMKYGVRAALYLLRNSYFQRHGLTTVLEIINRWAPAMDANPTKKYAEYVANRMGVKNIATVIDLNNDYVLREMFKAMAFFELGQELHIPAWLYREALNDI